MNMNEKKEYYEILNIENNKNIKRNEKKWYGRYCIMES